MPDNFTLYLMLVAALAIGFLLGRRDKRHATPAPRTGDSYFRGRNQPFADGQDSLVDSVVEAMLTGNDSVETRLALGALVRRRGEVDKAIRVHQGLLARPMLNAEERARTELELARDYLAAGLLGRAENLLLELTRRNGADKPTAQRLLMDIYQREREWRQAVAVGRDIARQDRSVHTRLAHFQCELAEQALAEGDLRRARQELASGESFDPACARLCLVGATVELEGNRPREARRLLERAVSRDPDCVPQTLAPYRDACRSQDDTAGYQAFLEQCLRLGPFLPAVTERAAHLQAAEGPEASSEFVMAQLLRNPNLGGFVTLLEHLDREGASLGARELALVRRFSESLLARQPAYRCRNCGFSSHSLMWQCPSCHEWGSCKPIVRAEQSA